MTIKKVIEIIDEKFGVSKSSSPIGSCKEDFINRYIINIAEKNKFPEGIINLFKRNPYKMSSYTKFDNGRCSGEYFINLVKRYF